MKPHAVCLENRLRQPPRPMLISRHLCAIARLREFCIVLCSRRALSRNFSLKGSYESAEEGSGLLLFSSFIKTSFTNHTCPLNRLPIAYLPLSCHYGYCKSDDVQKTWAIACPVRVSVEQQWLWESASGQRRLTFQEFNYYQKAGGRIYAAEGHHPRPLFVYKAAALISRWKR